ncbi:hypothetical protein F4553_004653 [Allocatelliglobosispora scoriae]|uniref:DUF11 domain-containing protein n=1 Tax=Allocatelliglobosispora scoriae TaxID=643052 RepID=A0A841BSS1_9ACTN|nr:hypothetical protein [Allocatelliglobosispora scoriae]MBB5871274.1 hypothetical protein [Allocatelliglobosispora scoriae]
MRFVRGMFALVVALLVTFSAGAAHAADVRTADLDPAAQSGHARVGSEARVGLVVHNHGPNPTVTAKVVIDVTAPGGTVFGNSLDKYVSTYYLCTVVTPHKRARCKLGAMWYPDNDQPSSVDGPSGWHALTFKVVAKCTTPGRFKLEYPWDPKPSNNSASLVVKVDGVAAKECEKPRPSPSAPKPAVVAAVSASPSVSPSMSPSVDAVVGEPSRSTEAAPLVAEPEQSSDSGMSTGGFIVGGIAVLLGVALLVGALWRGRQRSAAEEFDEGVIRTDQRFMQNGGL